MEISALVVVLAAAAAAVVVNSTPLDYAPNCTDNNCTEMPMVIIEHTNMQVMSGNKYMRDCPVRSQSRVNGKCQCPSEHPSQEGSYCCVHDSAGVVTNCDCPRSHVFKRNAKQLCYEINTSEYTITVDGVSMCQDEKLKTKDGQYCCVDIGNKRRICHCPKGKTYDHVANKCVKSFKFHDGKLL